jgi:hypothetical protein
MRFYNFTMKEMLPLKIDVYNILILRNNSIYYSIVYNMNYYTLHVNYIFFINILMQIRYTINCNIYQLV